MTVKIVTDSTADLPKEMVNELGISIIQNYVIFGDKISQESTEITSEEFYQRLVQNPVHPTTAAASPYDFERVYETLAEETNEIISIQASSKITSIYNNALMAKRLVEDEKKCKIIVIDSLWTVMAMGLLVISAARLAKEGKNLSEIQSSIEENIPRIHFLAVLDTLTYISKGGRAGKAVIRIAQAASNVLDVKPMITFKNGEISFVDVVKTKKKQEKIISFVKGFSNIKEIALEYSTNKEEVERIGEEISSLLPEVPLYFSMTSPALGVHAGPGCLAVSLITK